MHSLHTMKYLHDNKEADRILAKPETKELHSEQEKNFQRQVDEAAAKRDTTQYA